MSPLHPFIDHTLGLFLLGLVFQFVHHIYQQHSNAEPLLHHTAFALLITAVAVYLVRNTAQSVGQLISKSRTHSGIPLSCRQPLASQVAQKKWRDQSWQLVIHVSMTIWEVKLLSENKQWWKDPVTIFVPCPQEYLTNGYPSSMSELRLFYIFQLVLWIWTGVSCKFFEERRKDYFVMMLHHVMTVALVLYSFMGGELACGLVVLVVHDASDVVLDCMKMSNYLKVEDSHGYYVTEILFVLNTYVVWPYLRMYYFPKYVITAIYYGYPELCGTAKTPWPGSSKGVLMIVALFLLHCFWWLLLNKIALKLFRGTDSHTAGNEEYEYTMQDQEENEGNTKKEGGLNGQKKEK